MSEKELSPDEKEKKEKFVKGMKDREADFKKKYGDRWKEVMYATATKMAKNESFEILPEDLDLDEGLVDKIKKVFGEKPNDSKTTQEKIRDVKKQIAKMDNPNDMVNWIKKTYGLSDLKAKTVLQIASDNKIYVEENEIDEAEKMKGDDPCWDDYEMVGHKTKNGKKVPNCVPKKKMKEWRVSFANKEAIVEANNERDAIALGKTAIGWQSIWSYSPYEIQVEQIEE